MSTFPLPAFGRLLGRPAPVAQRPGPRTRPADFFDSRTRTPSHGRAERFDWYASSADLARGLVVIECEAPSDARG